MFFLKRFLATLFLPVKLLFTQPQKLIATPRKLMGLSLPARIAILVAIFLLVVVAVAYLAILLDPRALDNVWKGYLPLLAVLALIIPVVVYHIVRLWLEGEVSAFDDIDRAWKAGLAELERGGIDLSQVPVFLVLGSSGRRQEKALFQASQLDLTVKDFPTERAALHWYASPDAVYLVASEVGCLSALARSGDAIMQATRAKVAPRRVLSQPAGGIQGTMLLGPEESFAPRQTEVRQTDPRQTMALSDPAPPRPAAPPGAGANFRGTMEIPGDFDEESGPDEAAPDAALEKQHIALAREEAEKQQARLKYLCQLIRRARQPLCPINGVLTLLPYGVIQWGPKEGVELQKAIQSDLAGVLQACKLRCPVTAVVVGLEHEAGFSELVRRVGRERARTNRFGKGFELWDSVTLKQMEALGVHACGAFEDWVYQLFREKQALSKPGNEKLYTLLCNIRRDFQPRLISILINGYADPNGQASQASLLMGGCYFAATGDTEDRQAFVKGIFDKPVDQQEDLEWTSEALNADRRYRGLAFVLFAFDVVLAALLGGMIYLKAFPAE